MLTFYGGRMGREGRELCEGLEALDEVEEWEMIMSHYYVARAKCGGGGSGGAV
jgi:hypothetical protein